MDGAVREETPTEHGVEDDFLTELTELTKFCEANRAIGGSASSPDPKFNHGGAESLSDTTLGD